MPIHVSARKFFDENDVHKAVDRNTGCKIRRDCTSAPQTNPCKPLSPRFSPYCRLPARLRSLRDDLAKLFGLADPRSYGSGNPGATNVLRSGNKKAALFTLIGDALKGWAGRFRRPADGSSATALSASSPWPSSSATCSRSSSSSRAAKASPRRPAYCWRWTAARPRRHRHLAAGSPSSSRYSSLAALLAAALAPVYTALDSRRQRADTGHQHHRHETHHQNFRAVAPSSTTRT
jgi:hypothetical protein